MSWTGITAKEMHSHHRGEVIYTAEVDVHFPQLSVGDTLTFAARARQPRQLPGGLNRNAFADHLRDVVMAMFGISHTINTQVSLSLSQPRHCNADRYHRLVMNLSVVSLVVSGNV